MSHETPMIWDSWLATGAVTAHIVRGNRAQCAVTAHNMCGNCTHLSAIAPECARLPRILRAVSAPSTRQFVLPSIAHDMSSYSTAAPRLTNPLPPTHPPKPTNPLTQAHQPTNPSWPWPWSRPSVCSCKHGVCLHRRWPLLGGEYSMILAQAVAHVISKTLDLNPMMCVLVFCYGRWSGDHQWSFWW